MALTIDLNPVEAARRRAQKAWRLNVVQFPLLRLLGYALLLGVVFLNDRFIQSEHTVGDFMRLGAVIAGWSAVSWLVLYLCYQPARRLDLGVLCLTVDIAFYALVVYYTGGEKSWLFFIMVVRVVDQTNTSFLRCLAFAHLTVLAYVAMLLWVAAVDHRALTAAASLKAVGLYAFNLYTAFTARPAEQLRARTVAAIRLARDSVGRLEENLRQLDEERRRAEEANRAKSLFLANMSHELRTPLNGIVGMTDLVLSTPVNAEQKGYLQTVISCAEALQVLVSDILDLSRIEAGRIELESVPFGLRELLEHATRTLRLRAIEKGLRFSSEVAEEVSDAREGDVHRLRQILLNLIDNAIKFTDQGEVAVSVTGTDACVRFVVSDTGIGVPVDKRELVFEAFTQADSSMTRKFGGTGLGLAISRQLAERMGGTLSLEADGGPGSRFRLEVPLAVREDVRAPAASPPSRRASRSLDVLLVEDDAVNQLLAQRTLERWGHRVAVARDGREAVAVCAGSAFDVVLMDVQMPEMDGMEASRAIRGLTRDGGRRVPIVALTAHAHSEDRERCAAAGMDHYLGKPLKFDELYRLLERIGGAEA